MTEAEEEVEEEEEEEESHPRPRAEDPPDDTGGERAVAAGPSWCALFEAVALLGGTPPGMPSPQMCRHETPDVSSANY